MPTIGKMRRRYAKSQMQRLTEGGSQISDADRQQGKQDLQQGATAALGAQQAQFGQMAKAQTGGGVFQEQPFLQAQKGVSKQAADTAVKASGAQRMYEAQLSDRRTGRVLGMAAGMHDINRQNAAAAGEAFKWFAEQPSDMFADVLGAAAGAASSVTGFVLVGIGLLQYVAASSVI